MPLRILFAFLCGIVCFSACDDAAVVTPVVPTSDLTMTFKSTYDGSRMVKFKNYPYGSNNYPLQFNRFTLFLSDITLLKGTEETRLTESAYLDFTPDNASSDTSVLLNYTFQNVPEGTYTGIKMGYGVKPSDNGKNPADFPPSSPLYNDNEYWLGWKSYIFTKIEAQGDADINNQFDHFMIYHCGGNGVFKTFSFTQPIEVKSSAPALKVDFDLRKLFIMADGRYYNMVEDPATSNNKDSLRVANDIMSKFGNATSIAQ
ncbi:MAG: MbnP family protein [Saprospiraceae bacterium]